MKTSELTGAALDWAVWAAAGGAAAYPHTASGKAFLKLWKGNTSKYVHPSTDWSQGGPIIEREIIELNYTNQAEWRAQCWTVVATAYGPTPLIAAMRCYCCAKLGNEIEIPQELQPCQPPNL